MLFNELNSSAVHAAIINGCYRVIEQQQQLNQINVFPVADGDTGDNMAAVCSSIIEFSAVKEHLKKTGESIAESAIIGSRGNSGILLTHFFVTFAQYLPCSNNLNWSDFCFALDKIGNQIDSILSTPVEGTIITVIKKLAELANAMRNEQSIAKTMIKITPLLKLEVENTTSNLKILQEAQVVDAGALGFYYFIEGFSAFLEQGITNKPINKYEIPQLQTQEHHHCELPTFRYCTEAIVKYSAINRHELLTQLNQHGDCAAVVGTNELFKIHLHTNNPSNLFNHLYTLGTIKYPKVDDMHRQYQTQYARKYPIALVTDSSADLPDELLDSYQIHPIALNIHIGEHDFLDKYCFKPNDFYNQLKHFTNYPKTSCPNPSRVKQQLTRLRAQYDNILILSISSTMSGMHDAFMQACSEDDQIKVLDTKTNSAAHGLLLHYAGQLIAAATPFAELVKKLEEAIQNTFLFVLVNQFDSMVRSGRMNKLSATLASWAHIKPIVSIDPNGRGVIAAKTLSQEKGLNKLIELVQQQLNKSNRHLEEYCIVHADNKQDAVRLAEMSTPYFNQSPLFIDAVSLAIGLHAGKGCVALAARISP
ncbi:MAG: DegV family protein [bacterium]|nr:DegV family protein [bacterium]